MAGILTATVGTFLKLGVTASTNPVVSIKTSGTNNLSQTISANTGDVLLVMIAWDPSGASLPTITSVADNGGNTYTAANTLYTAPATTSAGTGVITQLFTTTVTNGQSLTITPTFSAAITAKAMSVLEVSKLTTTQTNTRTVLRGTTTGPTITTPSANAGGLVLVFTGWEQTNNNAVTGDTDTINGTWSTVVKGGTTGGSTGTNIMLAYQYKIVTATGTQANTMTAVASNWSSQAFAFTKAA